MTFTPEQEYRIRELFRQITAENNPKNVQLLARELEQLLSTRTTPTDRELRIIELVAQGLKNREIGAKLGISSKVVKNYLSKIYDKIGVHKRVRLALWYEARLHQERVRRPS